MLHRMLFPELSGRRWARINLNECSIGLLKGQSFQAPIQQISMMNQLRFMLRVEYTYGGYLEDRSSLLRDQYHSKIQPSPFIHLGMDFDVPDGTPVSMPVDGTLVYSVMDKDHDGGWGGKLIFKVNGCYLILGHLDEMVSELKEYKAGEKVAKVANYPTNGNWVPHLHIQCCREYNPDVDGYSHYYEGIDVDFPDPEYQLGAIPCKSLLKS